MLLLRMHWAKSNCGQNEQYPKKMDIIRINCQNENTAKMKIEQHQFLAMVDTDIQRTTCVIDDITIMAASL